MSGYYHQRPVSGSDGSTFSALDTRYSKDAKSCWIARPTGRMRRTAITRTGKGSA